MMKIILGLIIILTLTSLVFGMHNANATVATGMTQDGSTQVKIETTTTSQKMSIFIVFTDSNANKIKNQNYAITALQDGKTILSNSTGYTSTGSDWQTTNQLLSTNPVSIKITLNGVGISNTPASWTGSKEDTVEFYITVSSDSLNSNTGSSQASSNTTNSQPSNESSVLPRETSYNVYVYPLPDYAIYATDSIDTALSYWEKIYPNIQFHKITTPEQADLSVQWIRDYGDVPGTAGEYVVGTGLIQVGLGDSKCMSQWNPYNSETITHIAEHEIGHFLGLQHVSDPSNIMYPYTQEQYGTVKSNYNLPIGYGQFIPACTEKNVTSYNYHVTTNDPTYGFDVYFVPSVSSLEDYLSGKPFKYYSGDGCFAKNVQDFSGTCQGISNSGGLLVATPSQLSQSLAMITSEITEQSSSQITTESATTSSSISQQPSNTTQNTSQSSSNSKASMKTYVNHEYAFGILYPSDWAVQENYVSGAYGNIGIVKFQSDPSDGSYFSINEKMKNVQSTGNQYLNKMVQDDKDFCNSFTFERDQYTCEFNLENATIHQYNGLTHYIVLAIQDWKASPNSTGHDYNEFLIDDNVAKGNDRWKLYGSVDFNDSSSDTVKKVTDHVLIIYQSFSSFTILENDQTAHATVPEFPFAIIVLIIATLSIVLIPKIRHICR